MKSNLLIAVEWLWSHRGKNNWWKPSVLTPHNPDSTSPKLTDVEAVSIFKHLEEQELIFPGRTSEKGVEKTVVFFLHEAKEKEWNDLIAELKKPKWRQSKTLKTIGKGAMALISLCIAGFIGGVSRKVADELYDTRLGVHTNSMPKPNSKEAKQQVSNSPTNAPKSGHEQMTNSFGQKSASE